jgi:DNA-binding HxlR family transcriptional regulator
MLRILGELRSGRRRTANLLRGLPGLTAKVLHARLRELQAAGLVQRCERGGYPRHVEYRLTPKGQKLSRLIDELMQGELLPEAMLVVLKYKWMRSILDLFLERDCRASELKAALPGISNKVLMAPSQK